MPIGACFFWRVAALAFDLSWGWLEQMAQSGLALWWLPQPQWFALPLALLASLWLLLPRGVPGKSLAMLLWLPLLWPSRDAPNRGEAELVMIDVGQGLSMLVRTANHALLYDMGPAVPDGFDAGERAVVPTLRAFGVRYLDAVVISHGDNDHAGGLDAVRRVIPIRVAYAPRGSDIDHQRDCVAGAQWQWDGVTFLFLHPPRHFPYLGNEASCVLRIETKQGVALLTGDIGEVIERMLVWEEKDLLQANVVQIAHHGSKGSSDDTFVEATHAQVGLVSAGYANRFGHPHPAAIERWHYRGSKVFNTSEDGALRIGLRAGGFHVATERVIKPRLWDAVQHANDQSQER